MHDLGFFDTEGVPGWWIRPDTFEVVLPDGVVVGDRCAYRPKHGRGRRLDGLRSDGELRGEILQTRSGFGNQTWQVLGSDGVQAEIKWLKRPERWWLQFHAAQGPFRYLCALAAYCIYDDHVEWSF